MDRRQRDLWERLEAFDIDGDAPAFSFADRLARESGWSGVFARRVVNEYKRFVFLCMEAGHPCTPSEHVDQAWHLHLTYTRSYWERLCGEVLGRPLHHHPTRGGAAESEKFDDWYARTKESYERFFGFTPPSDIWTDAKERFGTDLRWRRVPLDRFCMIPRRWVTLGAPVACVSLVGFATIVAALATARGSNALLKAMVLVVLFMLAGVVSALCFGAAGQRPSRWKQVAGRIGATVLTPAMLAVVLVVGDSMAFPDLGLGEGGRVTALIISGGCAVLGLVLLADFTSGNWGWSGGACAGDGGCSGGCGGGCGGCGGCGG